MMFDEDFFIVCMNTAAVVNDFGTNVLVTENIKFYDYFYKN